MGEKETRPIKYSQTKEVTQNPIVTIIGAIFGGFFGILILRVFLKHQDMIMMVWALDIFLLLAFIAGMVYLGLKVWRKFQNVSKYDYNNKFKK